MECLIRLLDKMDSLAGCLQYLRFSMNTRNSKLSGINVKAVEICRS